MRQLILFIFTTMFLTSAFAFQDVQTQKMAIHVQMKMRQTSDSNERMLLLAQYRDFLFQRLNSIPLPEFEDLRYDDPVLEDYRSLTEYEGYISLIDLKNINSRECHRNKARLQNSVGRTPVQPPEAEEAIKILAALCS